MNIRLLSWNHEPVSFSTDPRADYLSPGIVAKTAETTTCSVSVYRLTATPECTVYYSRYNCRENTFLYERTETPVISLHYMLAGSMDYTVRGLETGRLEEGRYMMVYAPRRNKELRLPPDEQAILSVYLSLPFFAALRPADSFSRHFLAGVQEDTPAFFPAGQGTITAPLLLDILRLIDDTHEGDIRRHYLQAAVQALLGQSIRLLTGRRMTAQADRISYHDGKRICEAVAHARQCGGGCTVKELVEKTGLNEHRFRKGFRQLFCTGLSEFMHDLKMEEAMRRVISESKTLDEIGGSLGYSSAESFITSFKREFGITPAALRIYYRSRR